MKNNLKNVVLKNHICETIRNNPNCQFASVDPYGHNLTTVVGIEGGGTQLNHNTISRSISNSLSAAGIKHLGGATDRSCKTVFRNAVPHDATISVDSGNQINSMIPDLVTFTKISHVTRLHSEAPTILLMLKLWELGRPTNPTRLSSETQSKPARPR